MLEPEDKDGYLDDDGCPDLDNDGDGIPDAKDKCPNEPEDPDGFEDEDGCPEPDNDKDTVPDVDDECPNTPGQPNGLRPGCPSLIIITAKEIRITQQIQFDFNKSTIKPVSFPILDAVRDVLVGNPKITIEVQGHTDNVGQVQYNLKLSQQRADSVRAYLVAHGIEPARLVSKGFGMSQPLVQNNTEGNRALNRRVQFIRTEAQTP
jgi:outer membrane protein OmpA-like peptidoglycan-associated protein